LLVSPPYTLLLYAYLFFVELSLGRKKGAPREKQNSGSSTLEECTSQGIEEACLQAIASVLKNARKSQSKGATLTPSLVSDACRQALAHVSNNPQASTSKGIRNSYEGSPLTPRRVQDAIGEAVAIAKKGNSATSPKCKKRLSLGASPAVDLRKLKKASLTPKQSSNNSEESDDGFLTPDEYGEDGKTKPKPLEEKIRRLAATISPASSSEEFEKNQKDVQYYKGN